MLRKELYPQFGWPVSHTENGISSDAHKQMDLEPRISYLIDKCETRDHKDCISLDPYSQTAHQPKEWVRKQMNQSCWEPCEETEHSRDCYSLKTAFKQGSCLEESDLKHIPESKLTYDSNVLKRQPEPMYPKTIKESTWQRRRDRNGYYPAPPHLDSPLTLQADENGHVKSFKDGLWTDFAHKTMYWLKGDEHGMPAPKKPDETQGTLAQRPQVTMYTQEQDAQFEVATSEAGASYTTRASSGRAPSGSS